MGYLGTILTLYGCFLVGERKRAGFIFQLTGNLCWAYVGYSRGFQVDLIVVSFCFAALYAFNFWKWSRPAKPRLFDLETLLNMPPKRKSRIRVQGSNGKSGA